MGKIALQIRKPAVLIGVGLINLLHAGTHIIQFLQSMLLLATSSDSKIMHEITHNPIFSLVWGVLGVLTLVIGIRDYKHHKKHKC